MAPAFPRAVLLRGFSEYSRTRYSRDGGLDGYDTGLGRKHIELSRGSTVVVQKSHTRTAVVERDL